MTEGSARHRRVERLERRHRGYERPPEASLSPQALRLERRMASILESMSPEHRELFESEQRRFDEALATSSSVGEVRRRAPLGKLTYAIYNLSTDHGPAVMPPNVAQVYLDDPKAIALHDCTECGYQVPIRPYDPCDPGSPVTYFERCPLEGCDGEVGWYAYYQAHGHHPPDPTEESEAPTV